MQRNSSYRWGIALTSEGWRFLFFMLAVAAAAVNTGNNVFYLLLAMMGSVATISILLSGLTLCRVMFRRHLPTCLFAKAAVSAMVTIKNDKALLPSLSLRLSDVIDGRHVDRQVALRYVGPHTTARATYTFTMSRRGHYCVDGLQVATSFPFNLFRITALLHQPTSITVCPALMPLSRVLLQGLTAMGQERGLNRRGLGMGLYNLREYRPGDDSRSIHWMTTARTSKLMLKEMEADDHRRVTIRLSLVAPPTHDEAFERAVSICASLILWFHDRGYAIRLSAGEFQSSPATTNAHCVTLLHALAVSQRRDPAMSASVLAEAGARASFMRSEGGMVVSIMPWADSTVESSWEADCAISTAEPGEPVYAIRTRLHS